MPMGINDLPKEVLLYILEEHSLLGQWSKSHGQHHDTLHLRNPVWVISQVCQSWRHLAHTSIPKSWASFTLSDSMEILEEDEDETASTTCRCYNRRLDWALYRIYKQLMFSCDSSLDITIRGQGNHPYTLQRIMSLFNPHHRRWRSIDLHTFPFTQTAPLDQAPGYDPDSEFPVLEHLALKFETEDGTRTNPRLSGTFPGLKSLELDEHSLTLPPITDLADGRIPWGQLEEYELNVQSEDRLNSTLPPLTSVRSLRMGSQSLPSDDFNPEGPLVELPHVKTLEITYGGWISPLKRLVLPNLTRLVFSSRDEMPITLERSIAVQIRALTTRSKCVLTKLEVTQLWARRIKDMISLLQAMPDLRSLKIEISNAMAKNPVEAIVASMALGLHKPVGNTTQTLSAIIIALRVGTPPQKSRPSNLCMRLKYLSLTIPYPSDLEQEFEDLPLNALVGLVASRTKIAKLRSVEIKFGNTRDIWSPWSYNQMVALKRLGFAGMKVSGSWDGVEFDDVRRYSGGWRYALRYRFLFPMLLACQAGMVVCATIGSK